MSVRRSFGPSVTHNLNFLSKLCSTCYSVCWYEGIPSLNRLLRGSAVGERRRCRMSGVKRIKNFGADNEAGHVRRWSFWSKKSSRSSAGKSALTVDRAVAFTLPLCMIVTLQFRLSLCLDCTRIYIEEWHSVCLSCVGTSVCESVHATDE